MPTDSPTSTIFAITTRSNNVKSLFPNRSDMTKFNHKSLYLLAPLLSFSSTSCSDNDEPEPQPKPEPETVYSVQLTISDKGFNLGDGRQFTPGYLDASMAKVKTEEKDTYTDSRNAIWTSSYASRYKANTEEFVPSVREFVFDYDVLFVMSYDIIGKGNVRGVLAF